MAWPKWQPDHDRVVQYLTLTNMLRILIGEEVLDHYEQ